MKKHYFLAPLCLFLFSAQSRNNPTKHPTQTYKRPKHIYTSATIDSVYALVTHRKPSDAKQTQKESGTKRSQLVKKEPSRRPSRLKRQTMTLTSLM